MPGRLCFLLLVLTLSDVQTTSTGRVLVVGGSGRVGGSCARALLEQGHTVVVGGRSRANWYDSVRRFPGLNLQDRVEFLEIDATRPMQLPGGFDAVVNTAGPFQGLKECALLESCLRAGSPYVDVCDDIRLSRVARSNKYQALAQETKTSAVISAGIWPGVSSLLAQELLDDLEAKGEQPSRVRFNFFTAGSGGAGETILTATFLLLGEDVLTYVNGQQVWQKTATDGLTRDFGPGIGARDVVRLNLIETESCFASASPALRNQLSVETRFGTAPRFWNLLFGAMARVIPQSALQNRQLMKALAIASLPAVRLVDTLVGSANGIEVEVDTKSGKTVSALLTHRDLEQEVGQCLAAFASKLIDESRGRGAVTPSGVFYPEELPWKGMKRSILEESKARALTFRCSSL